MSGVIQNIDPPPLSPPSECVPSAFGVGEGHTRWAERGVVVNILEDVRHSSVLYICKYFVAQKIEICLTLSRKEAGKWSDLSVKKTMVQRAARRPR
jgi:hypothetical protein